MSTLVVEMAWAAAGEPAGCARLGDAIRARRESIGLSQERLAEQAGVHRTYVSMLERGVANPTIGVMLSVSRVLGVRLSALIAKVEDN